MSFYKTAKVPVLAVGDVDGSFGRFNSRLAAKTGQVSHFAREGLHINLSDVLDRVHDLYDISPNPKNYGLVAARANSVDVPNDNGDAFPQVELLRFDPRFGRRVYRSYEYRPHHINHRSENPKLARGVIIDAHYNASDQSDHFIEALVAFDKEKDPVLARGIKAGTIDGFSMGCSCEYTVCSVPGCEKVAYSRSEFCDHIRNQKMSKDRKTGALVFENCYGVEFEELSSVGDPADGTARTTELLLASRNRLLSQEDRQIVQRFAHRYQNRLPAEVVKALQIGMEGKV